MDKGTAWIQFLRHFRKDIRSFCSKCWDDKTAALKQKTIESVFYCAFKCMNMLSVSEKFKDQLQSSETEDEGFVDEKKAKLTAEEIKHLKDFHTAYEGLKATVGIGTSKLASIAKKTGKKLDRHHEIPAMKSIRERANAYLKETQELKDKELSAERKKLLHISIKLQIESVTNSIKNMKSTMKDLKGKIKKCKKDEGDGKEKLKSLAWDDVEERPKIIAGIKAAMAKALEHSRNVEALEEEIKEANKNLAAFKKDEKDLAGA
mmetsp:Transcript_7103/g.9731  ORF Transcript_7103/g.9731 Transcript_7103/m.9731 type:complete len:262 (+) Transcript_7103:428-1213(+)